LRDAAAEGRIEPDELEQRVEAALRARTYRELDWLVADLPRPPARPSRPLVRSALTVAGLAATVAIVVAVVAAVVLVALAITVTWWVVGLVFWLVCCGPRRPHRAWRGPVGMRRVRRGFL
jgi:hypothetical protein